MNRARPNEESGSPQITQIDADFWRREIHLRKSAKSADPSDSLSPREIEVHIDELILHGFDPGARWRAVRLEYEKLEKPLTEAELGGWR